MLEFEKKSDRQKGCGVLSKQVLDVRTDREVVVERFTLETFSFENKREKERSGPK